MSNTDQRDSSSGSPASPAPARPPSPTSSRRASRTAAARSKCSTATSCAPTSRKGLGFSREDRDTNIARIAFVANLLARNDVPVITAAISPYAETRDAARELIGDDKFIEIHVATSLEECEARDTKGLYAKARSGEIKEFTGISDPYEAPTNPEITIQTEGAARPTSRPTRSSSTSRPTASWQLSSKELLRNDVDPTFRQADS